MAEARINPDLEPLARPIESLHCDPRNARRHGKRDLETIAASLDLHGQQKPIVVMRDGKVIAGNGTLEAARTLGWDRLACVTYDDEDAAKAAAFAIVDNRSAELSEWDTDALAAGLQALPPALQAVVGWSPAELASLLPRIEEVDEPPPIRPEAVSKRGEVYELGPHRLICGDATSSDDWMRIGIGDNACAITSPPYGLTTMSLRGHNGTGTETSPYLDDEPVDQWPSLMADATALMLRFARVSVINLQMLASNKVAMVEWLHTNRDHLVDVAVWAKPISAPAMSPRVLSRAFEFLFILASNSHPSAAIATAPDWRGDVTNVFAISQGHNAFASIHRAVYPVALASRLIDVCSVRDTEVVDPFGGTGTTLIAAAQTGRRARLIEIEPVYCDVIRRRWTAWAATAGVDAGPGALA